MSFDRVSKRSKVSSDSGVLSDLDSDVRAIKITVYRNGDKFDSGTDVSATIKELRNWYPFLDSLTKKVRSIKAVKRLYDLNGREIVNYKEMLAGNYYVAATDYFKPLKYGETRPLKWVPNVVPKHNDPCGIDSLESVEISTRRKISADTGFTAKGSSYNSSSFSPIKLARSELKLSSSEIYRANDETSSFNDNPIHLPKIHLSSQPNIVSSADSAKPLFRLIKSYSDERIGDYSVVNINEETQTEARLLAKRKNAVNASRFLRDSSTTDYSDDAETKQDDEAVFGSNVDRVADGRRFDVGSKPNRRKKGQKQSKMSQTNQDTFYG